MLIAQIALSGPKSMFPNIEGRSTILQPTSYFKSFNQRSFSEFILILGVIFKDTWFYTVR